ncbi:MAG: isoprenylcysteine carboxylmethyltransferase family protein [Candidatus Hydrogenedentes bacterium]|nr:isoprenylcysteine carboxylmethyltransferase family protein [Candidatus Hydrogenedentota bacterium]
MSERFRRVFEVRGLMMAPPVLFIILYTRGEYENDWVVFPLGFAVFLAGVMLRVWAQMHLHYRLSERKVLTRTGPYAYVRNPIYIANTTLLLGMTVLSELLWFAPIMMVWCALVYAFVVRYEEAHLKRKYGEAYQSFLNATRRWIPRIQGVSVARFSMRKYLKPSILAELHCFLLVIPFFLKEIIVH